MIQLPNCSDYLLAIETPMLIKASILQGGQVIKNGNKTIRFAGGFCIVFPYQLISGDKVAVRCWIAHLSNAEERSNLIANYLKSCNLDYFAGFEYIPNGIATSAGLFPIVVMNWVDSMPLKEYLKQHLYDSSSLIILAEKFKQLTHDLHEAHISHGDLQHGNILISKDGNIHLVDYDSMYVPGLESFSDEIKGLSGYQHPARGKQKFLNYKTDYFSELIIYSSILALAYKPSLWTELDMENSEVLLFSQSDFDNPTDSKIFNQLKSDSILYPYINAIENALKEEDIENLLPLEESVVSPSQRLVAKLKDKWDTQPVPNTVASSVDTSTLQSKWTKPITSNPERVEIDEITSKWK